ncbi:hypothetical protein [Bacillus solimangrovi]|uniref:Imelysin-like domain-containing protein n=1 Tax=Bacillus solimangrovi TaxID=1305675 RepID=A0A1E5LCT4_9BACI|nr:hypothetical protein [Bacillus solimangrovi]OEH91897.1 hypothetical protein BFG57_03955 [Bacillus solimangrovi]
MDKKKVSLIGSLLLAGGILAGCSADDSEATKEPVEQTEEQPAQSEETTETEEQVAEQSEVQTQVTTYKGIIDELSKAKEDKEVNWTTVTEEYSTNLQTAVNAVSGEFDQALTAAMEGGLSGDIKPNLARQLIDKTTQSYFYKVQKGLHKDIAAAIEADKLDEAKALFADLNYLADEVLIPTAVKRDSYYELNGESSMEESIRTGLAAQEEALNAGNVEDFVVYAQVTDKSIYRSYYLAAQSYAEKIEKAVSEGSASEDDLRNMQAESWGFYQAINGSLSGGDEEAANKLNTLFSLNETDPASIKGEEVKDLFAKAFINKIAIYHEKAPKALEEGDLTSAKESALEGNVFLKDIELYLIDKLGDEKTQSTLEVAEQWFNAISEENAEEAKKHSDVVIATINELL